MGPIGGKKMETQSSSDNTGAQDPGEVSNVSTKLDRIASVAKRVREPLTALAHNIDVDWLKEAYRRTRKDGAVGVDGMTAAEYAEDLERNLRTLLDRAKSGDHYRAPPVRRVHIPKGDGSKTRPIGIPTFEDKVLQRAVVMVLEAVYEQEFLDCSYGFRPGRSAHQAVTALRDETMAMGGGWLLEADIESFFDTVDHGHLRTFLHKRVRDGVLLRLIGKWLNAGVMEEGHEWRPDSGTPQGGVISPLLANVYLHEVLDTWYEQEVRPRLRGRSRLVRFADDFVILFEREDDARRVYDVLPKRFGKYGLRLHPEKTRLIDFRKPPGGGRPRPPDSGRRTFDLLGFTWYWGRSRQGAWVVKQKTAKTRFARFLRNLGQWLWQHMHDPVREQHKAIGQKLRGHDGYYGVVGNSRALAQLRYWVERLWRWTLSRRSSAGRMPWERMRGLLRVFPLPRPHMRSRPAT
jgi:group II intron reverse transcriptase/maturase